MINPEEEKGVVQETATEVREVDGHGLGSGLCWFTIPCYYCALEFM